MKLIKRIAFAAILAIGATGAVTYTSCTKDKCKDVTCLNGGTCSDGNCTCPTGTGGALNTCETVFRTTYANTYVGTGTDNGTPVFTYANYRFLFSVPSSSTDLTSMQLTIQDATGGTAAFPIMNITLSNFTTSGSTFTINSTTNADGTYTGSGTITGTTASIIITQTFTGGSYTYTFGSLAKS